MKKILIGILMVMVILGLGASYIFSGSTQIPQPPITDSNQLNVQDFRGPTDTAPNVQGPGPKKIIPGVTPGTSVPM